VSAPEEWWCGPREEGCSWTGPFDTKAEAVEEILAELDDDEHGYVGRSGPLPYGKLIHVNSLIASLVSIVDVELVRREGGAE